MFDRLLDLLQHAFTALLPWAVIQPYERAIVTRLGQYHRTLEPGFHWRWPLHIEIVFNDHTTPRTERINGLSTTTADGKAVGFDAVVTYRISDIAKAVLEVTDLKDAIADACAGQIGTTLAESTWADVWNGSAIELAAAACRKRGWRWGVEIMSVQLAGVALVRNLRITLGGAPQHQGTTFQITQ